MGVVLLVGGVSVKLPPCALLSGKMAQHLLYSVGVAAVSGWRNARLHAIAKRPP